ncbi:MAG: ferritin-like domain-containing protein [Lachnospiraceae bacterium]|nr:ferritin-like domain-containing protein [Lachnospiraceae bacterium]
MISLSTLPIGDLTQYDWIAHFQANHDHHLQIDFSTEPELTPQEKSLISPSIQNFQKGEASEGCFLLHCAKRYAGLSHDLEYPEAMKWFVREENRHSAYLRKFMDYHQIPVGRHSFLDDIFRLLRKSGGLRTEIIVLVTAEMIALSYYRALAECIDSPALKSICRQMLKDELPHIVFQSYTLYKLKSYPIENLLRILLMEASMTVVWFCYKNVFRAGDYSYHRLATDCLGYLRQSIKIAENGTNS